MICRSDIRAKFGESKSQIQEKAKEKLKKKRDEIKEKTKSTKTKLKEKRNEVKEKTRSAKEKLAKKLGQNKNEGKDKFSRGNVEEGINILQQNVTRRTDQSMSSISKNMEKIERKAFPVKGNQKDEQNSKNNVSRNKFSNKNRTIKGINLGEDSKHGKQSPAISERMPSGSPENFFVSSNKKLLSLSPAKSGASSFSPQEGKSSSVTSRIQRPPPPTRVEKVISLSAAQKTSSSLSKQNRAKSASPNRPKSGSSSARRHRSVSSTSTSNQRGRSASHSPQ